MKRLKEILRNKKGMTMTNVLAAFAVLALLLALFAQAVNLSMNLYEKAEQTRDRTETLFDAFYSGSVCVKKYETGDLGGSEKKYTFTETDGGSSFTMKSFEGSFHDENGTVFFFGKRRTIGG